jgi:glycosyltransferase involved in cell wall biosynthesis
MKEINWIFLGGFPYPKGMAATRHIQLVMDGLKGYPDISIRVIILRQSSRENELSGIHQGIPYETVMGDALRARGVLMAPLLHVKARQVMNGAYQSCRKNILFVYGPPTLDNVPTLRYARQLGFKVVFYIVEDDDVASDISRSPWHRLANAYIRHVTGHMASWADGIVVISSRLEAKFRERTQGRVPLHDMPISVDMASWPDTPSRFGDTVTLFYAGSFGFKDGIPILLDAFDRLAARYGNVRLVLTGKGSAEDMHGVQARITSSPYRERIDYKGYLNDDEYQAELKAADVPCMTRIDHPYAHAGFPFKLGEYLATGKPVVASRVSDVAQWLRHRESAMLVEPGSAVDLVQAVEHLVRNPDEAAVIGRRGREVARRSFCHKRQAKALYDFVKAV